VYNFVLVILFSSRYIIEHIVNIMLHNMLKTFYYLKVRKKKQLNKNYVNVYVFVIDVCI